MSKSLGIVTVLPTTSKPDPTVLITPVTPIDIKVNAATTTVTTVSSAGVSTPSLRARIMRTSQRISELFDNPTYIAWGFVLCGLSFLILTICLAANALKSDASKNLSLNWYRISLPLTQKPCNSIQWPLRFISLGLNMFGTFIMMLSGRVQQLCTSPTMNDIEHELQTPGSSLPFCTNSVFAMFHRKHRPAIFVWFIMAVTSLPMHLLLNAIFGESLEFRSRKDLASQISTGTCLIVIRPWVSFVVSIIILVKAAVILLVARKHWRLKRYNFMGDFLVIVPGQPHLVPDEGCLVDRKGSKTIIKADPDKTKRIIHFLTWLEVGPLIIMAICYGALVADLEALYSAPRGETLGAQIWVIIAANIPQFIFSVFFAFGTELLVKIALEFEWRSYARKVKKPRTAESHLAGTRPLRFMELTYLMTFMLFATGVLAHFAISQKQDIAQVLVRPNIIILGFTYGSQKDAWGYVTYTIPICVVGFILGAWWWPLKGKQPVIFR
ncbi:hypothetical protein BCR37DRAFT_386772 [Protomyces lactucae-debilis]|uniref:DUF6536 domain-containing protein n=1 Tax=Protomyces lactucae-debilis TaxID=2754530 RepID=A0A1Y2FKL8_PROLT|nr:uncharacterized protein BCR37DRAFT_386772 [Protomyces lactucae-debilis]ORY83756.1 hypothetical protein BCR37DRAFT_386772 [Protomyces lactucae-debilis]